jgi:AcrR family transcriptional regulator
MKPTSKPAGTVAQVGSQPSLIWERSEPSPRMAPSPLSRDSIVKAAIAIADAEGLGAVSLRRVGASLDATAMRLYGYLSTKEELLELMVDAVYAEMAPRKPLPGNWRSALRQVAQRTRGTSHRHAWLLDLLGGRPHQGPNALRFLEASLAALNGPDGFQDIDTVMQAAKTFNAFLIGALRHEASERRAERDSGLNKAQWQSTNGPYIHKMIATGRFPTLAKVVANASHPPAEAVFDQGLECVLDGIAARIPHGRAKLAKK